MKFLGSDIHASIEGLENLAGTSNYFIGNDQQQRRTDVPGYLAEMKRRGEAR
jgi:hypothetical protein